MERIKFLLTFLLFGCCVLTLHAGSKEDIYNCYVNDKMPVWKSLIDQLNIQPDKSNELILELVNYQYGYIGWCLEEKRNDEALDYLELAEKNVKLLESARFELSLVNAYKAAFYGYHIALNKFSAPFIGSKSSDCAKQAVLLDPNQPFGYVQMGNVKFNSPSLMGGSKSEAIGYYLKARAMMEKNGGRIRGDWNYLRLLVTIAQAYSSTNDLPKAKLMYEEILKIEPRFELVRDKLFPDLLKKLSK
jgi:tetratricopeptide (TPR) repeat protein